MAVNELDEICAEFAEHAKTCPLCGEVDSARACKEGLRILKKVAEVLAKPEAA